MVAAHISQRSPATGAGRVLVIRRSEASGEPPGAVMPRSPRRCSTEERNGGDEERRVKGSCRDRCGHRDQGDTAVGEQRDGDQVQRLVVKARARSSYVVV